MPTINLNRKKKEHKYSKIFNLVYSTNLWKKYSKQKLSENPICEVCKINYSVEVHHIIPISIGQTDNEIIRLGFDYDNLQSICKDCHLEKHNKKIIINI